MQTIGFEKHDHDTCAARMLGAAETYCAANKLQFTATRRRVLEILLEGHKALGAYDILARLQQEGRGAQPSVAYRALDFLLMHGFAHKLERLNAYVACAHPHETHAPAFMICRQCGAVAEVSSSPATSVIGQAACDAGFRIEKTVIEAEGLCPQCIAGGKT
ncbi:transcriptional repressor [Breoghania sp.]|uniref:transcriptional repressor n=1 Tax=Breoghania sp. TaxID=2065378 RepID=UPI002AABC30A|nr:transcriptional repressor [Breoghania sp.]